MPWPTRAVALEDLLAAADFDRRPTRAPDHAGECEALAALADALAQSPRAAMRQVLCTALRLCRAQSAGIGTVIERADDAPQSRAELPRPSGSVQVRALVVAGLAREPEVESPARHMRLQRGGVAPRQPAVRAPARALLRLCVTGMGFSKGSPGGAVPCPRAAGGPDVGLVARRQTAFRTRGRPTAWRTGRLCRRSRAPSRGTESLVTARKIGTLMLRCNIESPNRIHWTDSRNTRVFPVYMLRCNILIGAPTLELP